MTRLLLLVAALPVFGCSIDPVITNPEGFHGVYDDCKRAARDYCRDVVDARESELKRCVSEHTYMCVAGPGAKP